MKISDMTNDQNKKLAYCHTNFIQNITEVIKLTQLWKFEDQINTIKILEIKLKYGIKNMNQLTLN